MPIRILIADDTTLLRRLLIQQLSRDPDFEVVGEAENGQEAIVEGERLRPDVILMDLNMPVMNGVQATVTLQKRVPQSKVLLLTSHEELASLGQMAGSVECLKKSCTPSELAQAIRRVARQAEEQEHPEEEILSAAIDKAAMRGRLTEREHKVLHKLVASELTIQQIATALEKELGEKVTESAVKHTTERLMRKLDIDPKTRATLIRVVLSD